MEGDGCGSDVAMDSGNPLLRAVFLRRLRLTRLLLEGGAYINESNSQGRTPLMVACRTQHVDSQSASRVKLVQFLLEKGADPNIQDKEGRSALMHACQEQAGPEVVSLLLGSGADVSLEDRSGSSALVYAVVSGDWTVLKLLLDTCKAKGKEVIIITAEKSPCGKLQARQYLSMAPLGPLDPTDNVTPAAPAAPAAPASPSEIQLITSPQSSSSSLCPPKSVFSFKEVQSNPCSPSRFRGPNQVESNGLQQPLLRLNSEPWLKIPVSLLARQPRAALSPESGDTEDASFRVLDNNASTSDRFRSYEGKLDMDDEAETRQKADGTMVPGRISSHSASHPNLHSENLGADSAPSSYPRSGGSSLAAPFPSLASSSLRSIIQRRKLGPDIFSSDPQLAGDIRGLPEDPPPKDGKRLAPLRCSRDSLLSSGPSRRAVSGYERRGSGASLLEHNSQARPRSLPPLTLNSTNSPVPNVPTFGSGVGGALGDRESGLKHFVPSAPPGHPREQTRRMLLRRHSMQTEQFKSPA